MTESDHPVVYDELEVRSWLERFLAGRVAEEEAAVEMAVGEVRESLRQPGLLEAGRDWFQPLVAIEGCWLERAVTIRNAHTGLGAGLLGLQQVFFQASQRCGHPDALQVDARFGEDIRWLTALGQEGAWFPAAVVGVTLAHAELGGGLFAMERVPEHTNILNRAKELLRAWPQGSEEWLQAIYARALYRQMTLGWCREWLAETPLENRILALLRAKAEYGQGYHGKVEIGGRCLDDWLGELAAGKGEDFLRSFLDSRYVDRLNPEASRFLSHSTAFGGPMYGVFNGRDRELLRRWFKSPTFPASREEHKCGLGSGALRRARQRRSSAGMPRVTQPIKKLKPPQLYHNLINDKDTAVTLPAARHWVDKVLGRARWLRKGYFSYSQKQFYNYVDRLHGEAAQWQSRYQLPLSRAACVWGIEQFAPAILVDGGWLQSSLSVARQMPEVGEGLWQIWRDELGDGRVERHHGNIYRQLLDSVDIHLPPFDSEAFIQHPGFVTGAFDLPAFLLAIGRFPERYLPEILGLNLAIELSGLGRTYQNLAERMESVGLDATIVRLHQSIDNLACGHAALARESIITYLNRFEAGGMHAVERQWRRIWTGWRSLTPASLRFTVHLLAGWVRRFGSHTLADGISAAPKK